MVPTASIAQRIAFYHASMFSPALSTFCDAIEANRLSSWPELTVDQVKRHPPQSVAMVKGHLDQQRTNVQSTQPKDVSVTPTPDSSPDQYEDDLNPAAEEPLALNSHFLYAACETITGKVFTDQTGRFLTASDTGNKDMLVLYDYDSNYIHVEPMKDKTGAEILAAYKRAHSLLCSRGLKPQLQKLDNEASAALREFLVSENVDFQLAPPHVHRRNAAERAIRTFKNHFIAGLCTTDRAFPLKLWDRLLPQALITLNTLRGS